MLLLFWDDVVDITPGIDDVVEEDDVEDVGDVEDDVDVDDVVVGLTITGGQHVTIRSAVTLAVEKSNEYERY